MLIKREEVSKKSNANNEPVAPKKRKSHENAKEDKQLAKKLKEDNEGVARNARQLRPGSDAVLQPSRIEFNELSSCEVRRLNQLGTADLI